MVTVIERFKSLLSPKPKQESTEQKAQENTSKENFNSSTDWVRNLLQGKSVGGFSSKFISDIYNERILYPHEEMEIATKLYKYNSYVNSAVNTRANLMIGGQIKAVAEKEIVEEKINDIIDFIGLKNLSMKIGVDGIKTGNFYAKRIKLGNKVVKYDYIPHSERMYADLDELGKPKRFVQEKPNSLTKRNMFTITYYDDRPKSVKGIEHKKEDIFHLKLGDSEIDFYGRGPVASVINDGEVLLEIERAIAVFARYKAIPKHVLQLDNDAEDMVDDGSKAATYLSNQLSNLSDMENIVLAEKLKIDKLSHSGADMGLDGFLNYLKKKITVALAPSFIMHGEETNYAVSQEQRELWLMRIRAERDSIAYQIKEELLDILPDYGITTDEFEISFGDVDLGQAKASIENARSAFQSGVVTLNEAREMMGLPEDEELGDMYATDIMANSQLMGMTNGSENQIGTSLPSDSENNS